VTGDSAGPDLPDRRSAKVLSQKAFGLSDRNAAAVSSVKVAGPGVMQTADTARRDGYRGGFSGDCRPGRLEKPAKYSQAGSSCFHRRVAG